MAGVLETLGGCNWEDWSPEDFQQLVNVYCTATCFQIDGQQALLPKHDAVQEQLKRLWTLVPEVILDPVYIIIDSDGPISAKHKHVIDTWPQRTAVSGVRVTVEHPASTVTAVSGSTRMYEIKAGTPAQAEKAAHVLIAALLEEDNSAGVFKCDSTVPVTQYP